MDSDRLKMKIGEHEFDAQGPTEVVDRRLADFKKLVELALASQTAAVSKPTEKPSPDAGKTPDNQGADPLAKIMRVEERIVSLTVRAQSPTDAVLLILLGQRQFRQNDAVTGMEVNQGLTVSGQTVGRVDRVLDRAAAAGHVIVIGQHRGRRYRLTNSGLARAGDIANALIATVA
jgi:hypothetical protein